MKFACGKGEDPSGAPARDSIHASRLLSTGSEELQNCRDFGWGMGAGAVTDRPQWPAAGVVRCKCCCLTARVRDCERTAPIAGPGKSGVLPHTADRRFASTWGMSPDLPRRLFHSPVREWSLPAAHYASVLSQKALACVGRPFLAASRPSGRLNLLESGFAGLKARPTFRDGTPAGLRPSPTRRPSLWLQKLDSFASSLAPQGV
jgi:hypothetical protein